MSKPSRRASRAAERAAGRAQGGSAPGRGQPAAGASAGGTAARRDPSVRAGRRERPRTGFARRSFAERYRGLIFTVIGLLAILLVGAFVFTSATAKSYTCSTLWDPTPSGSPAPQASGELGYPQPDMGRSHNVSQPQTYTLCPPASGSHINSPPNGPIPARLYGPDDFVQPQGWIHNLEHGAIVFLYKCPGPGCDDAGQTQFKQFYQQFVQTYPKSPICGIPAGQLSPVIARFDDMKWPFAAIVWDRVLPLDQFDPATVLQFYATYGEHTNPEQLCAGPSASPGPSGSDAAPSSSAGPSGSAVPSGSAPATSAAPSPS